MVSYNVQSLLEFPICVIRVCLRADVFDVYYLGDGSPFPLSAFPASLCIYLHSISNHRCLKHGTTRSLSGVCCKNTGSIDGYFNTFPACPLYAEYLETEFGNLFCVAVSK